MNCHPGASSCFWCKRRTSRFPLYLLLIFLATTANPVSAYAQKADTHTSDSMSPGAVQSKTVGSLSTIQFEDITQRAGINFHLTCGTREKLYIMDALCGGVAFIDYNADGWPDIFLVNGATRETMNDAHAPGNKLYRNNRDGTFTDVTAEVGLTGHGWGMGVAVGDYDNDGFDDLYITYLDHAVLFHNELGRKFTDVTARAGVGNGGRWGTSAAFADYDNDGHLDLYVANYVDVDLKNLPSFGSSKFCQYRGIPVSCGPRGLKGSRDRLYHNRGDGTFEDVTEKANIDPQGNYGLGVVWLDYNNDGCMDIYVADDSTPSMLYRGDCKGGFTEVGAAAGVAYSSDGLEQAGMGVDAADYDHDGFLDLVKTNFSDDSNNLYHNDGSGEFTDMAGASGFGPPSIPMLGFGAKFIDADNDGWSDIFVANGHVNPQVDGSSFGVTYAERNFLFHNLGGASPGHPSAGGLKFAEIGQNAGAAFRTARVGRGAAVADFDNDGRLDLLVGNLDANPLLLHNVTQNGNHWLAIKTVGTRSNRDGIGARIEIEAGGMRQVDEVRSNSSYLSASDLRVHFGLGKASRVDRITVRWPSGQVDTLHDQRADRVLVVRESGH